MPYPESETWESVTDQRGLRPGKVLGDTVGVSYGEEDGDESIVQPAIHAALVSLPELGHVAEGLVLRTELGGDHDPGRVRVGV